MKLYLYSTSSCQLCEQAEAMLRSLGANARLSWDTIDIADDEQLIKRYELRIPVLYRPDTDAELCWPFSEADILGWLKSEKAGN